jgi:predicted metal-binding protein
MKSSVSGWKNNKEVTIETVAEYLVIIALTTCFSWWIEKEKRKKSNHFNGLQRIIALTTCFSWWIEKEKRKESNRFNGLQRIIALTTCFSWW